VTCMRVHTSVRGYMWAHVLKPGACADSVCTILFVWFSRVKNHNVSGPHLFRAEQVCIENPQPRRPGKVVVRCGGHQFVLERTTVAYWRRGGDATRAKAPYGKESRGHRHKSAKSASRHHIYTSTYIHTHTYTHTHTFQRNTGVAKIYRYTHMYTYSD